MYLIFWMELDVVGRMTPKNGAPEYIARALAACKEGGANRNGEAISIWRAEEKLGEAFPPISWNDPLVRDDFLKRRLRGIVVKKSDRQFLPSSGFCTNLTIGDPVP